MANNCELTNFASITLINQNKENQKKTKHMPKTEHEKPKAQMERKDKGFSLRRRNFSSPRLEGGERAEAPLPARPGVGKRKSIPQAGPTVYL